MKSILQESEIEGSRKELTKDIARIIEFDFLMPRIWFYFKESELAKTIETILKEYKLSSIFVEPLSKTKVQIKLLELKERYLEDAKKYESKKYSKTKDAGDIRADVFGLPYYTDAEIIRFRERDEKIALKYRKKAELIDEYLK